MVSHLAISNSFRDVNHPFGNEFCHFTETNVLYPLWSINDALLITDCNCGPIWELSTASVTVANVGCFWCTIKLFWSIWWCVPDLKMEYSVKAVCLKTWSMKTAHSAKAQSVSICRTLNQIELFWNKTLCLKIWQFFTFSCNYLSCVVDFTIFSQISLTFLFSFFVFIPVCYLIWNNITVVKFGIYKPQQTVSNRCTVQVLWGIRPPTVGINVQCLLLNVVGCAV